MALETCRGCRERDARILQLERRLAQQQQRADELEQRVGELQTRLRDALARLGQNATNSSLPPAANPPDAPKPVIKKRTGKKPGGQPGHPAHLRQRLPKERVSRTVDFVPRHCDRCQQPLPRSPGPDDPEPTWHQVAELPEQAAEVTEYLGHYRTCPGCGTINHAPIRQDLKAHSIGPRFAATLAYLAGSHRVSKRGLEEIAADVSDVPLALGTIANLDTQMREALAPAHAEALEVVRTADVKNVDETSWKLKGQRERLQNGIAHSHSAPALRISAKEWHMAVINRYKKLELAQIRSFSVAALQGNFTTAAERLGLSVTTVWQQVRALERRLGTTLLRARGRSMALTPEGQLVLDLVHPHLSGLDSLERLFEARRAELPQHVTVASTYYLLSCHLPRPLQAFAAKHPSIRLQLRAGIWPEVIRRVENGEADLGLVSYAADGPRSPHLTYEPIFHLHFTLLVKADHPLARRRRVHPKDLVEYPLIMAGKETFSYRTLESILNRHDLVHRIHAVMDSPTTDLIRKYVQLGLGIALTYMGGESKESMPGVVQRVFDPRLEPLPVYLVVRKDAHLPEAVQEFRDVVRRLMGEQPRRNGAS